ncbi:Limulus clotting factor C like protein [Argiope bruennichi]|uniref:Limulus clotting factor C like protein n=1 Tax=Argiope bruennichi TaxID=94029 RepID=A0A8T0ELT6_ARGBR|nr:Limulus clotting factor C like protein [Argiope bruennichi]
MSIAAFFLEIILASIVIASVSASIPNCISCPCGSGIQNYTHCIDKSLLEDFTCERWSRCQTCKANTTSCITCPPDRFGPTCSEKVHIRKKRQDDPELYNHPRHSSSCPFLDTVAIRWLSEDLVFRYCTARCLPGYQFEGEDDVTEITLRCRGRVWVPRRSFPPCRSGGYCEIRVTGAGFYNCTIDMDGTHCDITCDGWHQGRYHCYPGRPWEPPLPFCTTPKDPEPCRCQNGGVCDVSGKCTCLEGRTGTYCENLERQRATCPDPGVPRDGSRLNPDGTDASYPRMFEEGESVIFTCNGDGFALQGTSFITCLEDGTWSAPRPRCVNSQTGSSRTTYCPDPGYIQFGTRINADGSSSRPNSRYSAGQSVVYYCQDEYELVGNSILTCLPSGRWSSGRPSCRRINFISNRPTEGRDPSSDTSCRHPGVDVNGKIEDHPLLDPRRRGQTFPPGTELRFDCNDGFEPEGATILSCMASGEWTSAPPTCRKIPTTTERPTSQAACRHPGAVMNGRIEDEPLLDPRGRPQTFPTGTELTFRCDDGFEPEDPIVIACLSNGEWTPYLPSCRKKDPNTVSPPAEVTQLCPVPEVNPNSEIEDFFRLDPRKKQGFEIGEELIFKCKEGYDLEGTNIVQCLANGRWSNPSPTCNPKSRSSNTRPGAPQLCPPPEVSPNAEVEEFLLDPRKLTQSFEPGAELTFRCREGYVLEGWSTIRCIRSGRWSNPSPKCNIKPSRSGGPSVARCLNPGTISNGRVVVFRPVVESSTPSTDDDDYDFPYGTHLKYTCEDGFFLEGQDSLSCESNGYWTGSTPICVEDCGRSLISTTDRVTHGTQTLAGEWPWTVALAVSRNGVPIIVCGGALLDRRTVLTAAHCLPLADNFTLYFGKYNRSVRYDDREVKVGQSYRLISHPNFNGETFDNDIALIKFQPDVRYSERIQPVCLPTFNSTARNVIPGRKGYVTGWGINENKVLSDELMMAHIPVQSDDTCLKAYQKRDLPLRLNAGKFCAGYPEGITSTCRGDSGSPLVFYERETDRHIIEGIVSFGITGDCSLPEKYTVFAKVSHFLRWILRNRRG